MAASMQSTSERDKTWITTVEGALMPSAPTSVVKPSSWSETFPPTPSERSLSWKSSRRGRTRIAAVAVTPVPCIS